MHIQSRKLDGRERVPKTQLQAIPLSLVSFRGNDPQTCMHLAQNIVDCVNSYTEGVKACIHLHFLVAQSCKAIGVMMTVSIVELVVKNAIENDALKVCASAIMGALTYYVSWASVYSAACTLPDQVALLHLVAQRGDHTSNCILLGTFSFILLHSMVIMLAAVYHLVH
eukprot:scaffold49017_cov22-Tisochrysis_lutea.AAC.1